MFNSRAFLRARQLEVVPAQLCQFLEQRKRWKKKWFHRVKERDCAPAIWKQLLCVDVLRIYDETTFKVTVLIIWQGLSEKDGLVPALQKNIVTYWAPWAPVKVNKSFLQKIINPSLDQVLLARTYTLAELARTKRQFLVYCKQTPCQDLPKLNTMFVQYINANLTQWPDLSFSNFQLFQVCCVLARGWAGWCCHPTSLPGPSPPPQAFFTRSELTIFSFVLN